MKTTLASLIALCALTLSSEAQSPCMDWSGRFSAPGFDDTVTQFRTLDDGSGPKLYAVGTFEHVNGLACDRCARFDGASWTPVLADPSGLTPAIIRDIIAFDDGLGGGPALYAVGDWAQSGGGPGYAGVARRVGGAWTAVGSGVGFAAGVGICLQVYDAGSGPALYVGGEFIWVDTVAATRIARWDGANWSALGQGIGGASVAVLSMAVYDNGTGPKLYASGSFTIVDGHPGFNRIAAWDGSSWAALGSGANAEVHALAVFDDGSGPALYAGGEFTLVAGVSCAKIARWNGTWSALTGAGVASNSVGFAQVDSLQVADPVNGPGATLFVGGNFDLAGGQPAKYVAGYRASSWFALGSGMDQRVRALGAFDAGNGGRLYSSCLFHAGGLAVSFAARWNGAAWETLSAGHGLDDDARALHVWNDGTGDALYAAGTFEATADNPQAERIVRWNGTNWASLGSGIDGLPGGIASVGSGPGSKLYVCGNLHFAGGVPVNYVAGWDGSTWSALGPGLDSQAKKIISYDDGTGEALYVAGSVSSVGAHGMARWDGASWHPVDSGFSGEVWALETFDDGTGLALYAAGVFTFTGQPTSVGFARWNGAAWTALSPSLGGAEFTLRAYDDGTGPALYLGGTDLIVNATALGALARWNGTGWDALAVPLESSLGPPTVYDLAVLDDGSGSALYAAGVFDMAGGVAVANIARWNGSNWSALGSGLDNQGRVVCAYNDGKSPQSDLYVSGVFRTAGGMPASHIACWYDHCATAVGTAMCFGDGSLATACPCANYGANGRGCANSIESQGALLGAVGETDPDSVVLQASGMPPKNFVGCIFLQGNSENTAGFLFGDGVRCAGGQLIRLGAKACPGGAARYPETGDPRLSVRGGVAPGTGTTRIYQTYYREVDPSFCPTPPGSFWNVSNGVRITW